ncbi:MAG: hypothetical protein ACHQF0_11565 [Chitinophagales bacterium]
MKESIRIQSTTEDEKDFVFLSDDKKAMKQLNWDGDDEFSLNGEMYDVIEKRIEKNKIIIRALADKKETALLNKVNEHWKENDMSNKIANELFQLLQTLFPHSGSQVLVLIKPPKHTFYFYSTLLPLRVKKIPTPPPQSI